MYAEPRFLPAGDRALTIELGDDITPETNGAVRDLLVAIEENPTDGVFDIVPSYRSILVHYDPLVVELPQADSLCLHGDTPGAVEMARAVREGLESAGVKIVPMSSLV